MLEKKKKERKTGNVSDEWAVEVSVWARPKERDWVHPPCHLLVEEFISSLFCALFLPSAKLY